LPHEELFEGELDAAEATQFLANELPALSVHAGDYRAAVCRRR
jgi:hypothetical protein